jgi:hypothetical protein
MPNPVAVFAHARTRVGRLGCAASDDFHDS